MEKRKVFMIMPFEDPFFDVFKMLCREFEDTFEFRHAGDSNQQNILRGIMQSIYEADVIVADLTGLNPNVMYELGVAHTFNKKTIVITQDGLGNLPFDIRIYRAVKYSVNSEKFVELLEYMTRYLHGAVTGNIVYDNPVKDFINNNKIDNIPWFSDEKIVIEMEYTDKGFWDFIDGIKKNTEQLTKNSQELTNEMNTTTDRIKKSVEEIKARTGKRDAAAFYKREMMNVAMYTNSLGSKLKAHNINFANCWDGIEKNIVGLLETNMIDKENRPFIIEYIKTLKSFQCIILKNKDVYIALREAILANIGGERTLNKAIHFLDENIQTYIGIIDSTVASIDKIIRKSKFIVGEIDFSIKEQS